MLPHRFRFFRRTLLLLPLLLILAACHKEEKPKKDDVRPVKTMVVGQPKSEVIRNFPARVLAHDEARLAFEVPGRLVKFPVVEGQEVKEGELLAALDPHQYEQKVNETKAQYIRAKADYDRAEKLVKNDYISRTDYDKKRAEYIAAEANYNTAKRDLRDTKITAPFAGLIARKLVKQYENVKAKEDIVLLQDVETLDIEINVPEYIILNLKKANQSHGGDTNAKVILEGAPTKEYALKFKEFSSEADPETQTYRVVFMLPAPANVNVFPGMTATVKVPLPDLKLNKGEYIAVPSEAVVKSADGKPMVWVVDTAAMTVSPRHVEVSRLDKSTIRILSGLKSGETIVIAGAQFLQKNQKVSIMQPLKGS